MHEQVVITGDLAGKTLAAILRQHLPGKSWSEVRQLVAARLIKVNDELWLDDARRLKEGDKIEVLTRPVPRPRTSDDIPIRYVDEHLVVVEKPAGIATVRHPAERDWPASRRALVPTLDDLVIRQLRGSLPHRRLGRLERLRIVHRLDKETSGLVVFVRSVAAERGLGKQFHRHTVIRKYLAVAPGQVKPQTVRTSLVRDRGDGRRGSTTGPGVGKKAITHIVVLEQLGDYSLLSCRLETGRTHQIRIHLAELGHPVCGEKVYNRKPASEPRSDTSGAPRLALHAAELGFVHPITGEALHWSMPLPADLQRFVEHLRSKNDARNG
jgi:23S rRNA pseudouridine1911/1915/1917 synthase